MAQPWRCLWRALEQITRITPLRRTILQFSQSFLTEARTFIFRQTPPFVDRISIKRRQTISCQYFGLAIRDEHCVFEMRG